MAAGLGFKDFTTGEVLTAADVDGYLMQGVWVFASATARDAAVTSPQEGNFAYLKDTNVTTYYTGSAWANLDTTGMTNPMTTTGDTIYSSSGSTPARLGIGTAGQVLQVNSGATAPEWATASSGGMTLISTTTLTGASITLSSIPATYNNLQLVFRDFLPATDAVELRCRINNVSTSDTYRNEWGAMNEGPTNYNDSYITLTGGKGQDNGTANSTIIVNIYDYANADTMRVLSIDAVITDSTTPATQFNFLNYNSYFRNTVAVSSLVIYPSSGNFTSGTVLLYGVK
jgi:hypothetical protein